MNKQKISSTSCPSGWVENNKTTEDLLLNDLKEQLGTTEYEHIEDIVKHYFSQAIKQAEKRMLKKAIKSLPEEVEVGFEAPAPPDPLERWRDTPDKECLKHCDETYNYCIKRMKKNLNSLKEQ